MTKKNEAKRIKTYRVWTQDIEEDHSLMLCAEDPHAAASRYAERGIYIGDRAAIVYVRDMDTDAVARYMVSVMVSVRMLQPVGHQEASDA